jgi:hypothetical protein
MTPQLLERVFEVLDIVVFEEAADGAFTPITTVPGWMAWLSRDGTFPFLGDFLTEARAFWNRAQRGRIGSGLLAVDDAAGREFHVEVWAATAQGARLLLFERPPDAESLRKTLQRAREEVLAREAAERKATQQASALDQLAAEVRASVETIRGIVETLGRDRAGAALEEIVDVADALAGRALQATGE